MAMRVLRPGADAVPSSAARVPLDLGEIYRAHASTVWRWARRLMGADRDLEDVLHEVFLVAQRKLAAFDGQARVTTWLYAITVRVVQHRRRKERWTRWWRGDRDGDGEPLELPARGPSPLEALEQRRASELVYRILDSLRERDRTVLILFELEGLTGPEIAAVTGQSLANVWVRLHRARGRFLQAMTSTTMAGLPQGDPAARRRP
jgi:RNA polymerase sigma-70 factor (ECF subfamily)